MRNVVTDPYPLTKKQAKDKSSGRRMKKASGRPKRRWARKKFPLEETGYASPYDRGYQGVIILKKQHAMLKEMSKFYRLPMMHMLGQLIETAFYKALAFAEQMEKEEREKAACNDTEQGQS